MLTAILFTFGAGIAVMLASLAGVIFTHRVFGTWMNLRLAYLTTFAGGVLAVLVYHLIEESFHDGEYFWIPLVAMLGGVCILEGARWLLSTGHHHHEAPTDHAHTHIDGRRLLVSDSFHHVVDGFLMVPAFLIDWRLGLAATAGIFLHEVVLQISQFFILKEAGYSNRRALTLNFAVASTILVGITLALTFASFDFETTLVVLTGIAAGGFIWVILRDLLPHTIVAANSERTWFLHASAAILGVLMMFGASTLIPHEHHDDDHDDDHEEEFVLTDTEHAT